MSEVNKALWLDQYYKVRLTYHNLSTLTIQALSTLNIAIHCIAECMVTWHKCANSLLMHLPNYLDMLVNKFGIYRCQEGYMTHYICEAMEVPRVKA